MQRAAAVLAVASGPVAASPHDEMAEAHREELRRAAAADQAAAQAAALAAAVAERAQAARASRSTPRPQRVVSVPGSDFNACVRNGESTNNYAYSGYYHGAYNMTLSHWDHYHGYARPEDAPPDVQDAKFNEDKAQGSGYMHQQYPVTSKRCGM